MSPRRIVGVPDERSLQDRARKLQQQYLDLFSGPELEAYIADLEQKIAERESELESRLDEFSQKVAELKKQLEALRDDASSMGVRRELELMIKTAEDVKQAPGKPADNVNGRFDPLSF